YLTLCPHLVFEPGRYEVMFDVRSSVDKTCARGVVMGVEVFAGSTGVVAQREVTVEQVSDRKFHPVVVPFTLSRAATTEFRVKAYAQGILAVGRITVRPLGGELR